MHLNEPQIFHSAFDEVILLPNIAHTHCLLLSILCFIDIQLNNTHLVNGAGRMNTNVRVYWYLDIGACWVCRLKSLYTEQRTRFATARNDQQ